MWSRSRSWAFRSAIWASRAFRRVRSAVMMLLSVSVAGGGGGSGAAASGLGGADLFSQLGAAVDDAA
ncbi:hypothetical protein [Mycolicibacterium fortuitum]